MSVAPTLVERARKITRAEFDRMVDAGLFQNERVELWKGVIVQMSPQKSPHAAAVQALTQLFVLAVVASGRAAVRIQLPLALSDDSEPEPDVAIVAPGEYRDAHPSTAMLVIEVADSSLEDDLGFKSEEYAAAGIPEYWIVNLRERTIEVHANPREGRYQKRSVHSAGSSVAPSAFSDVTVDVSAIVGK